ncbi:MAG: sulfatase-like hydrolase/transferase [Myxococcota bacterium]
MTLGTAFLWTLAWVVTWSAMDLGMAGWILAHELPPSVMTRKNDGGHSRSLTISFLARLAGFTVALALVLASLLVLFEVRWLGTFFALLSGYVFVYNAVQNPQIFDEYASLREAVRWCTRWLGPGVAQVLGFATLLLLNAELVTATSHHAARIIAAVLVDVALVYYLVAVQTYSVPRRRRRKRSAQHGSADDRLNLILIGVDSLRRDVLESYLAKHPNGALAKLLAESTWFEHTVAPIGRTFPALVSIFAATNPIEHGVRDALSSAILEGDKILTGSPTWRLRHEHGYQTHVAIDDSKFAYFRGGETFDSNRAPRPGIGTHLLPILFRNKIFFALLNNRVGYALFPEIKNNAAFFFAYKLGYFTDEARDDLARLEAGAKPFFATFHSCGLHWPGSAAYPYYPRDAHPPKDSLAFGYMSGWMRVVDAALRTPDKTRVAYNRRLYELGAAMVIERFVEPLLEDLEAYGLLERSMVVFYSDHAEALGTSAPLPVRKVPTHGTSLLWDDDSVEETVLAIRLPTNRRERLPDPRRGDQAGTIDILPTFLDAAGLARGNVDGRSLLERGTESTRLYISETALWLREAFRDQLMTKVWKPSALYRLEPRTGELYLAPESARQLVSTKQRAIYQEGHRLTLYPTLYGYRIAVERLSGAAERDVDRHALLDQLLARFAADARQGLLPNFLGLDVASGCLNWIELRKAPTSSLLRLQRAIELAYRYHHIDHALAELATLALDKQEDAALRISAFDHLLVVLELTSRSDANLHAVIKGYELPRLVEYIDPHERARLLRLRRQFLNAVAGTPNAIPVREIGAGHASVEKDLFDTYQQFAAMARGGDGKTANAQRLRNQLRNHRHFALVELSLSLLDEAERLSFDVTAGELTIDHLRGLAQLTNWHRERGLVDEPGEALARGLLVARHHGRTDLVVELASDAFARPMLPLRVSLTQLFPALDAIAEERGVESNARFKLLLADTGSDPDAGLDSVRLREQEILATIRAAA